MDTRSWYYTLVRISLHLVVMVTYVLGKFTSERKQEKLFHNSTVIADKKITCENVHPADGKFPADTWVCHNLRVSSLHVRYWYIPGFGADTGCSDGRSKYDSRNDLAQLCRELLKAHSIDKELWTTYVNKASCRKSPDKRMIFTLHNGRFRWEKVDQGNGYVITLRCMAVN